MTDEFDELDRALFALPLATPPPGLRTAILRATIDAPASVPTIVPFSRYELVGIGLALAVATWLLIAAVGDHRFAAALIENVSEIARRVANPATLTWITTGGAIAALFSLASFTPVRRHTRES